MGHDNRFGTILQIGDVLVSEDVISEYFACDYEVCKGACCIEGDSGAPLLESELDQLERHYEEYCGEMSEQGRSTIEAKGFFEVDFQNDIVTPVVEPTGECAYTHFDAEGHCLCAIEKCFFEGRCSWRKPQSCALYPIRVTELSGGGQALNLHHWDICQPAFDRGRREKIRAYEFLRGPIVSYYGQEFYDALCAGAQRVLSEE